MFNKKTELPKLSYLTLRVNVAAIEQWLPNQRRIEPTQQKNWESFDIKEYKITVLPTEPLTFYHNQVNEFSPSLGGLHIINNKNVGCIEWSWNHSYFYLSVSEPRVPIFAAPLDEMLHLIKTGSNLLKQFLGDEEVIKLGSNEYFDEVYRSRHSRYSLAYSNSLVSLTLVCASPNDLINY